MTRASLRSIGWFRPGLRGRARDWNWFLHTGEALGWPGQLVAATTSLGAAVLVWTGLALALRRLLRSWRSRVSESSAPEASPL